MKFILALLILLIPSLAFSAPHPFCKEVASGKIRFYRGNVYIDHFSRRVVEWIHIEAFDKEDAEEALKCAIRGMTPPLGSSVLVEESAEPRPVGWVNGKTKWTIDSIFRRPLP